MKKYLLIFLILFSCPSVKGQDTITYKFVDENILDYNGERLFWFAQDFSYQRIYIKDSIFKETPGLLYDGKPYKFKIQKGCWYINKTGKWQLFYSPNINVIPKIKLYYSGGKKSWLFDFETIRTDTLFGHYCIIYTTNPIAKIIYKSKNTIEEKRLSISHIGNYWFSPELGIIKIETGGATNYIREDIIN